MQSLNNPSTYIRTYNTNNAPSQQPCDSPSTSTSSTSTMTPPNTSTVTDTSSFATRPVSFSFPLDDTERKHNNDEEDDDIKIDPETKVTVEGYSKDKRQLFLKVNTNWAPTVIYIHHSDGSIHCYRNIKELDAMLQSLKCNLCGVQKSSGIKLKLCSKCKNVYYCSRRCQKIQWNTTHRLVCCSDGTLGGL
eukprot:350643_1